MNEQLVEIYEGLNVKPSEIAYVRTSGRNGVEVPGVLVCFKDRNRGEDKRYETSYFIQKPDFQEALTLASSIVKKLNEAATHTL